MRRLTSPVEVDDKLDQPAGIFADLLDQGEDATALAGHYAVPAPAAARS